VVDLSQYLAMQKRVRQLQADVSRAEGAHEQLLRQLKKEFNCSTVAEAKKLLGKLETELEKLDKKIATKAHQFQERWDERLRLSQIED